MRDPFAPSPSGHLNELFARRRNRLPLHRRRGGPSGTATRARITRSFVPRSMHVERRTSRGVPSGVRGRARTPSRRYAEGSRGRDRGSREGCRKRDEGLARRARRRPHRRGRQRSTLWQAIRDSGIVETPTHDAILSTSRLRNEWGGSRAGRRDSSDPGRYPRARGARSGRGYCVPSRTVALARNGRRVDPAAYGRERTAFRTSTTRSTASGMCSCSQIRRTAHPARRRSEVVRISRSRFAAIFCSQ